MECLWYTKVHFLLFSKDENYIILINCPICSTVFPTGNYNDLSKSWINRGSWDVTSCREYAVDSRFLSLIFIPFLFLFFLYSLSPYPLPYFHDNCLSLSLPYPLLIFIIVMIIISDVITIDVIIFYHYSHCYNYHHNHNCN